MVDDDDSDKHQHQQHPDQDNNNHNKDDNKDDLDEEGLRRVYDVILVGTGLVQAILAAALARAGQSVLHTDAFDFYGQLDAVWTLPYLLQSQQEQENHNHSNSSGNGSGKSLFTRQRRRHPGKDDTTTTTTTTSTTTNNNNSSTMNDSSTRTHDTGNIIQLSPYESLHDLKLHSMSRRHHQKEEIASSSTTTLTTIQPQRRRRLDAGTHVMVPVWGHAKVLGWKHVALEQKDKGKENTTTTTTTNIDGLLQLQSQQPTENDLSSSASSSSGYYYCLVLELTHWKLAHGACARLSTTEWSQVVTLAESIGQHVLTERSRSFALDVNPGLIWAQGPAVQGLLRSSVSDYIEFKSLEKLWWYDDSDTDKSSTGRSKAGKNNNNNKSKFQAVPCSKNDVFASTLLSPMEKRRLMTFLQLALDYTVANDEAQATATATAEVSNNDNDQSWSSTPTTTTTTEAATATAWETLNERHLNQGRSLARPQNKSVSATNLTILQQCIREEMDWQEYLDQHAKLSPKLAALVRFALTLDLETTTTAATPKGGLTVGQGMQRLGRHLSSLGRFGSTAFLVPLFGSGELAQAFCRSAAVYGATYLLRRCAASVQCDSTNENGAVQGVYLRPYADYGTNEHKVQSSTRMDDDNDDDDDDKLKLVQCSHVIVPELAVLRENAPAKFRVLRRVSILLGKPTTGCVRHAILLPPGCLKKSQHSHAIHGIWLDESVNVTPMVVECGGCSILHLTTIVSADGEQDQVLEEAMEAILEDTSITEIHHVSFSFPLGQAGEQSSTTQRGLHVIRRQQPNLTLDEAFEIAQETFSKICPGVEFLSLSQEIDNLVKERFGDRLEEDDEQRALSNAMNLIQPNQQSTLPLFIWLGDPGNKGKVPQRLLLPVPRPVDPTPSCLDVDALTHMIQEHCSAASYDPRVYFATCSGTNQDTLEFAEHIKTVISSLAVTGLHFHVFTNGTVDVPQLSELGLDGIHVSLFAGDAAGYDKATNMGEQGFQSSCDFIARQTKVGMSVEVGLLAENSEAGRVFARTLGAKEVHIFHE